MLEVQLKFDKRQMTRISDSLRHIPGGTQKAMAAAINKVMPGVCTDAVKTVNKVYIIKQADIRATMTIRKAYPSNPQGIIRSYGGPIPSIRFKVRPGRVGRRPSSGIYIQNKRSGGGVVPGTFIAQMESGHVGVFERVPPKKMKKDPKKDAIEQIFGPSVPSMLKDTGANKTIQQQAAARLIKAVDHEIYRILKGFGK